MIENKVTVLDVSSHSGRVDFETARMRGIDGVICRMLVIGSSYDLNYFKNWDGAKLHFPIRGVYVNVGSFDQVKRTLNEIDRQFPVKFPPMGIWVAIETQVLGNWGNGYWLAVQLRNMNRGKVGIYSAKWVQDRDDASHAYPGLATFPLWVAHYARLSRPIMPSYWLDYFLWQYSADGNNLGEVFGQTSDDADLSHYNGSLDSFRQWAGVSPESERYIPIDKSTVSLADFSAIVSNPENGLYYRKDLK